MDEVAELKEIFESEKAAIADYNESVADIVIPMSDEMISIVAVDLDTALKMSEKSAH